MLKNICKKKKKKKIQGKKITLSKWITFLQFAPLWNWKQKLSIKAFTHKVASQQLKGMVEKWDTVPESLRPSDLPRTLGALEPSRINRTLETPHDPLGPFLVSETPLNTLGPREHLWNHPGTTGILRDVFCEKGFSEITCLLWLRNCNSSIITFSLANAFNWQTFKCLL